MTCNSSALLLKTILTLYLLVARNPHGTHATRAGASQQGGFVHSHLSTGVSHLDCRKIIRFEWVIDAIGECSAG